MQRRGLQTRILSSEEEEKLKRDQALVSDFKQQKLEKEAQKNWDLFTKETALISSKIDTGLPESLRSSDHVESLKIKN